jgi:hypothetical protein
MPGPNADASVVGGDVAQEFLLPGVGFNAQHLFHKQHRVVSVELRKSNKWVFTHFLNFLWSMWAV